MNIIQPQRYIYRTTEAFQIYIHKHKINIKRKIKYRPLILSYVLMSLKADSILSNRTSSNRVELLAVRLISLENYSIFH
jgi:hypothetical protein